ncbi:MAG: hypothetical protein AAF978_04045 [Cyanobacteria bacterium P01_E01_bin.48]
MLNFSYFFTEDECLSRVQQEGQRVDDFGKIVDAVFFMDREIFLTAAKWREALYVS